MLLLAGDIERNPGPGGQSYEPRGELDMFGGLSRATAARMRQCLQGFSNCLSSELGFQLEDALSSAEMTNMTLRAYGRWLFAAGRPRYQYVYTVTGVQRIRPEFRMMLGGAWHVDRMWQLEQPGQCRAVLSAAIVSAILCLGLLWGWKKIVGIVGLGFAGMLHPNEFINLVRRDLCFPEDALGKLEVLYVHIRNRKTSRFARRQHARVDDPTILLLARCVFFNLPLEARLLNAGIAVLCRQWNCILDFLEIPRRQATRGATPGVLRGGGATQMYLETEDVPRIAWRGRWTRQRTLEYYVQEVAAQLFMHQLSRHARDKISFLEGHCLLVLSSQHPDMFTRDVS